jgi:hypothetical protein
MQDGDYKMKKLIAIISLIPIAAFAFTISIDFTWQRTDGSKLWDVWYNFEGITDCVKITVKPVTESGEGRDIAPWSLII